MVFTHSCWVRGLGKRITRGRGERSSREAGKTVRGLGDGTGVGVGGGGVGKEGEHSPQRWANDNEGEAREYIHAGEVGMVVGGWVSHAEALVPQHSKDV